MKIRSNVVWICHHLTANSDASLWWQGMVGQDLLFDPAKHFIVCANILGSCYGTTGPLSEDPVTGSPYYQHFPLYHHPRHGKRAHPARSPPWILKPFNLLIGGSMGGYQALEWAVMEPQRIGRLILLSTSAAESAWGIAVHTAQRMAIEADSSWKTSFTEAGKQGLKAARAIGLISYRNHEILVEKQTDEDTDKMDGFQSFILHGIPGRKTGQPISMPIVTGYSQKQWTATYLRKRQSSKYDRGLNTITQTTLIFGIHSDILCPLLEQEFLLKNMPDAKMVVIDSALWA